MIFDGRFIFKICFVIWLYSLILINLTLRLNLRGADPGRHLVGGTYAAECNLDLFPAINKAREICHYIAKQKNTDKSGEEILLQISNQLEHPDPNIVIKGGFEVLQDFKNKDILLGAR